MELEQAIFTRRSIRKYNDTPVDRETIEKIIEAGAWAPSACNVQGWRFIVIDEKKVLNEICENGAAAFLKNVNQAIAVIYDNRTDNVEYNDYIQSDSACIEKMLLMAHSLNVGACWINFLPTKKKLRKILDVPPYYDPIAIISIGYYNQKINERARKFKMNELIYYNRFTGSENNVKGNFKLKIRRIARKCYMLMPVGLKKRVQKILNKNEKKFDN